MIVETFIENDLVERKSNQGVYIRNTVTNAEYEVAVDLTNEERQKRGFEPYYYEETDIPIEIPEEPEEETQNNESEVE